jgi:hypothetical protein
VIHDDDLDVHARALLDAARPGLGPDAAAIARVRARVATTLAGGVAAATAGTTARAAASTTTTTTPAVIAGALGGVALVAAVIAGVLLTRTPRPPLPPRAPAPVAAEVAAVAPASVPPPVVVAAAPVEAPSPVPAPAVAPGHASPPRPAHPVARPAPELLAREVALVDEAMTALRHRDPRAALTTLHRYDGEIGRRGQLTEEAAAIDVEARCLLDEPGAAARLASFVGRWPRSAQRARLTTACATIAAP